MPPPISLGFFRTSRLFDRLVFRTLATTTCAICGAPEEIAVATSQLIAGIGRDALAAALAIMEEGAIFQVYEEVGSGCHGAAVANRLWVVRIVV